MIKYLFRSRNSKCNCLANSVGSSGVSESRECFCQ